ncbi:AraC family transcriptional regulator [Cellulomonas sp. KRMCY2]|uniref:helix-turn-helix transcriptional regulator n=1 Tax=Cellulomonas sp. KRMCY2 TaxID=1304865 RepID=UPI0009DD3D80|nr:AraC family transcriptional regulator [Cellulomonas sp. KRMCY2]
MDTASDGGPVLIGANWYRFRSGERISHAHVQSVSFVWVAHGTGTIVSGGQSFAMTTHAILRLPWRHDVHYRPDAHSPFHVGIIHLIPWHDAAVPVEPRVAFQSGDALVTAPWRRAAALGEHPVMMSSRSISGRNVIALASHGVERFLTGRTGEAPLRALGVLISDESSDWAATESVAQGFPTLLDLMIDCILRNIDRHLTVAEIADAGQCSITTTERLFARYTGLSVIAWSRLRRMQEAALLLRTSDLRVNEVARHVGYVDPLYFSRVFSGVYGVAPSKYASSQLRP